ncbi:pseudouridine synthase [Methylobacterium sp. A54F]
MSDIPDNDHPDPAVGGPEARPAESSGPWTPETDANRPDPATAPAAARTPRKAAARGGDAPLRRRAAPPPQAPESSRAHEASDATPEGERIAKAIARAGLASRRDAEAMIEQGRVTLNGAVLTSPAVNVTEDDRIVVDGEPLPPRERTRLWIFHKPRGLVTTARDPEGRQTVFEALPEEMPRVVAVGRLDINTEGLLLLTNDGGLAKVIAHPDTGWLRRYRVRAHGDTTQAELDRLRKGVTIDDMEYGPVEATLDRVQGDNLWLTLGLREGKNREVKRILEHLGLSVNRLIRLSFGPFQLGDLEPGLVEEVRTRVLKDQLGQALAAQAEVDFESPVREPIAPFGSPKAAEAGAGRPDRPRREGGPARPAKAARIPTGGSGAGPRRSVWRSDAVEETGFTRPSKVPRRGADPKAAREASAARGRERVGAIQTGERRVLVERLQASPAEPPPEPHRRTRFAKRPDAGRDEARPPRRTGGAERRFAEGDARPARRDFDAERPARRDAGTERPARRAEGGAERPARGQAPRGDRPFRPRGEERAPRGEGRGFDGPRPEGGRPGGRPGGFKGGFKGAPREGGEARPGGRPGGFKAGGARGDGAKPGGFKTGGFKPGGSRAGGFKAGGSKPGGFKAGGARPGGKPGAGRSGPKPGGRPPRGDR